MRTMRRVKLLRIPCWVGMVLVLNLCIDHVPLALASDSQDGADATKVISLVPEKTTMETPESRGGWHLFHFDSDSDTTGQVDRHEIKPIYKKWWFWAASGAIVLATGLLVAGGEKVPKQLPDFPEPPGR